MWFVRKFLWQFAFKFISFGTYIYDCILCIRNWLLWLLFYLPSSKASSNMMLVRKMKILLSCVLVVSGLWLCKDSSPGPTLSPSFLLCGQSPENIWDSTTNAALAKTYTTPDTFSHIPTNKINIEMDKYFHCQCPFTYSWFLRVTKINVQ